MIVLLPVIMLELYLISMDHHSLLGNTISLIAADKSMAINKNTKFVFTSKQDQK